MKQLSAYPRPNLVNFLHREKTDKPCADSLNLYVFSAVVRLTFGLFELSISTRTNDKTIERTPSKEMQDLIRFAVLQA